MQSSPLENYQPKPELHTSAKKLNTLIRHTNTNTVTMMTNTDLGYTRSRVKSMDTTQQR